MKAQRGFTLIEVLVAMALVSAVVAPASLWFYRKSIHAEAFRKLYALTLLEERLHLAAEYPEGVRLGEEKLSDGSAIVIGVEEFGGEIRIRGRVKSADGRVLAALETARYLSGASGGRP